MKVYAKIVRGPESSKVSRENAESQLKAHPAFPKGATFDLEDIDGRWIAAIAASDETVEKKSEVKEAELPFSPEEDGPAEESGPPTDDGPPSDDAEGGEEKPEGESPSEDKGEKHEKGEKGGELAKLEHLLTTLLTALGISPDGPESPVPGLDEGPPAPPPGHPGEGGGPPTDAEGKTHTVHERALKPGEAPPGTTPIGSPAFAATKVADDHPWSDAIGVKRSFPVEEVIGDTPLSEIKSELDAIADGTGYQVKQLVEGRNKDGQRTAKALIAR